MDDATVLHAGPAPTNNEPAKPAVDQTGKVIIAAGSMTLGLKRAPLLAEFRIVEAAGPMSANQMWMNMAMPLIFIAEIDGAPIAPPTSKMQIEALVQRLGDEGYKALMKGIEEYFSSSTANPDLVKNY